MTMARLQKSASSGAGSLKHESRPEIEIRKYALMSIDMRKTGFDVVGDIPWGTHFCLFYETKADLLEIVVAYCKAGLEAQEFCLWVVASPLTVEEARHALKQALPDCDRYFADESIEIVPAPDWYLPDGTFDLNRVICGWNEKLARSSARGYAGVRVTGDTAWLEQKDWRDFCEYEELLNHAVTNQRIAVLCSYPLVSCSAAEILDVVRHHQFAVTQRRGNWDVIETAGHKQAKAEIKRLNEELEQRVAERTSELTALNTELTKEVLQRQRAEKALLRSESYLAEAQRASRTGSFGWSVSSGDIVWSDETFRILELDRANKPTVEFVLHRTHPEDRAFVQRMLDQVARERKPLDVEHRLLMSDGSVKYVRVVGHPSTNHETGDFEFVGAVTDITDRKRVEEALRRSEGYLAQAQSLTQSGSWAWNVHTDARFWSQETFRIFGYDPGKMTPTWSDILERTHPEDREAIEQQAKLETMRSEDSEFDWRIVLPDGGIKHLHSISHPVMDESGQIIEIVGTLMDVTERKRAEALRDGESRILEMIARDAPLEEILERLVRVVEAQFAGMFCSVLLLDSDGQHVRHGAAPSLPKSYVDAIDGLSIGPYAGSCGTAMYRKEPVVVTDILQDPLWEQYRNVAEPHGLRSCWSTPILAHSGKVLGSFAMYYREPRTPSPAETRALEMATHIAGIAIERKLTHERLERSEAYLAEAQRLSHTGSWAFNAIGPVYWSEENFRIWGLDPQQGLPDRELVLQRIHPDDRGRVLEYVVKALRDKEDYAAEFRIVLPEGTIKYIHGLGHPVFSSTGDLVEVVGTQVDVTERKRAEQERERLRQLQADLAHTNRVTTMGELTASLAHEIKQPMTAALTDARTCLRWLRRDQPDVSEAREAASRLVTDVSRAAEIISRISLLFKKAAPQRELVDVNELIREMIVLLRNEAARHSISIRSDLADDLPKVIADRIQLQQVFMNLMLNGIEAMKDIATGGELTVSSQRGETAQVLISVADAGLGLPPEIAANIFDAFYTTKPQGTGMGLPISRSIIESHGGRLWANPNFGRGAVFQFTLPNEVTAPQAVVA
jgi:PAS domain S-box-containing protein